MILTKYLSNNLPAIANFESIAVAQDFFSTTKFTHFPVIEGGIYVGNLVSENIMDYDTDLKVKDFQYDFELFFARNTMAVTEVLDVFATNETNLIPVLDENNQYIGYYELEKVAESLCQTPFLKEKGSTIIIKKSLATYSMQQIAQIVESNNGKLLGAYVSAFDEDLVEITLKTNLLTTNDMTQTFRRYGYEIVSNDQQDDYIDVLKEHSDYLNKYLNI